MENSVNPNHGPANRLKVSPDGRQVFSEPGPWSEDLAAGQGAVDLAGDVALEDADDLAL
jgi:hypothetical protein